MADLYTSHILSQHRILKYACLLHQSCQESTPISLITSSLSSLDWGIKYEVQSLVLNGDQPYTEKYKITNLQT